jgi:hypothetical protein
VFPLHGRDLIALGWQPGRELGQQLSRLRQAWAAGGFVATGPQLLDQLARQDGG